MCKIARHISRYCQLQMNKIACRIQQIDKNTKAYLLMTKREEFNHRYLSHKNHKFGKCMTGRGKTTPRMGNLWEHHQSHYYTLFL